MAPKDALGHPEIRLVVADPGVMSTTSAVELAGSTVGLHAQTPLMVEHTSAVSEFGLVMVNVVLVKHVVQFDPAPSRLSFATAK